MKKFVFGVVGFVLCLPSLAVTTDHDVQSVLWAQTSEFNNVAYGILRDGAGNAYTGGTATVVRNNSSDGTWLIATGHQHPAGFNASFGFGSNMLTGLANGDDIAVAEVFFHDTLDLSLIRLSELVPGVEALPFYGDAILEGQEVYFAGYGDHGLLSQTNQNGMGGTGLFDGNRRAAFAWDNGSAAFLGQPYSRLLEADTGLLLAGIGQSGDSGSGIRIAENDIEYLLGVMVSVRGTGARAWNTYIPFTADIELWASQTIAANPHDPTAPIPEPSTLILLVMGVVGTSAKAKKSL